MEVEALDLRCFAREFESASAEEFKELWEKCRKVVSTKDSKIVEQKEWSAFVDGMWVTVKLNVAITSNNRKLITVDFEIQGKDKSDHTWTSGDFNECAILL